MGNRVRAMIALGPMPFFRLLLRALVVALLLAPAIPSLARRGSGYAERPEVREFIAEVAQQQGLREKMLTKLFSHVETQTSALRAMSAPVSSPPKWFEYAPQFLSAERIA